MNTVMEALALESSRKSINTYTREDGYRIKVVTSHDKQRKAYRTTISACVAEKREGYTMERHTIFTDLYRTLNVEPAARFNFTKLQAIHTEIVEAMIEDVKTLLSSHAPIQKEGE
jgi:hypothetical protein